MKKILVALDGSAGERSVLDAAVLMANALKASLLLVRVVGIPLHLQEELVTVTPAEFEIELERRASVALEALGKTIPRRVAWSVLVEPGNAWVRICAMATEQDVDLIVIGAHGYGRIERWIGTTASRVVNHADRSVLVVRDEPRLEPAASAPAR